jgi:hypothetical protein
VQVDRLAIVRSPARDTSRYALRAAAVRSASGLTTLIGDPAA